MRALIAEAMSSCQGSFIVHLNLAVILDAYSRRCIGWALDGSLEAELAVAALRTATRHVRPGLVHHSDRGVQYASCLYHPARRAWDAD